MSEIPKGGLDYYSQGIKRLPSLKEVDLNLNGGYNKMTLEKIKNISLGLEKFPHLKSFKLLTHG